MFVKSLWVSTIGVIAAGVTVLGSGGTAATELKLRIPDETAPPGGMVQMKVLTTEVTPISGGRPGFFADSLFGAAAGFSLAAPNGEVAGAAIVEGPRVHIVYTGTSLLSANYPILTVVLPIRPDATVGTRAQFALDPGTVWDYSTTGPVTAKVSPATVTVAGPNGVAINDVVPGEGMWPAGTIVSVRGVGFNGKTSLRVNDAGVKTFTVVSAGEIQFPLTQATEMRGLRITVQGQTNSSTYYVYMRGITAAVSSRTLLAMVEPIFNTVARTTATFAPIPALNGAQYGALAMQNPAFDAVTVKVAMVAPDGTPLHESSLTLAGRHRLALELSELLDGVPPPAGASIVVTATSPIDVISLLCDEAAWSVSPSLPVEAQPQ